MEKLAVSIEEARKALGLGRITAYRVLPTVRFGRRRVVPLQMLQQLLKEAKPKYEEVEK